jgi:hypothetical protein
LFDDLLDGNVGVNASEFRVLLKHIVRNLGSYSVFDCRLLVSLASRGSSVPVRFLLILHFLLDSGFQAHLAIGFRLYKK